MTNNTIIMTQEQVKEIIKEIIVPIRKDIGFINRNTRDIKKHLETLNSRVGKAENNVRNLQEEVRHQADSCPHGETITILKENLLTGTALKKYITEQRDDDLKTSGHKMKRFEIVIIGAALFVSIATLLINIYL
jgi:phage-related tail protein